MSGQKKSDTENRRKEQRVAAAFPVRYSFIHSMEKRDTKMFRTGVTQDVSLYGVSFLADVVDPSIIPSALRGEIVLAVTISLPGAKNFQVTCRLAWSVPQKGNKAQYLVGAEYTDADDASRQTIFAAAQAAAKEQDPDA